MIFFDTETTGLLKPGIEDAAKQPQMIEVAAWSIDRDIIEDLGLTNFAWEKGCATGMQFTSLVNPGVPLPAIITKITGLTDKDLELAPTFPAILPDLIDLFRADADQIFVAHNVPFDLGILMFELRRCGWEHRFPYCSRQLDTVQLSGGKKLINWATDLDVANSQTHRAMDDVRMLVQCYAEHSKRNPRP